MHTVIASSLALLLLLAFPSSVWSAWPNSPFTNLPICTANGSQIAPRIASDGAGGAIITWDDHRSVVSNVDIYAQRVLASGAVDPAWPANGRTVCTAVGQQNLPTIVSDGAGGAIVTWADGRVAGTDIYAQHVLASGAVDPAWPANGRALCSAPGSQVGPSIASDGEGGAIVAWVDRRGSSMDIYAQHVLASGTVDPAWPVDGIALCTAQEDQTGLVIVSDGAGGAIVAWHDLRSFPSRDIYAQHVFAGGVVDPAWPVNGRALCTATDSQVSPSIVSDGVGGAIVAWQDKRGGDGVDDVYAQHVLASGVVDGSWPTDGRAVCTAAGLQSFAACASDGAGGAIITWYDGRNGLGDIYAQHLLASGLVDAAWPSDGRSFAALAFEAPPDIVSDGNGGSTIVWVDARNGNEDIFAQHVLASGVVDATWPASGRAVSTAANAQIGPMIVADDGGGTIVSWYDARTPGADVYAQRVARHGYLGNPEAEIVSVQDVPSDQGGVVKLSWNASYLESDPYGLVTHYKVFRSVPANLASALRRTDASVVEAGATDGTVLESTGDLLVTFVAGTTYYWEFIATVNADFLAHYSYLAPTVQDSGAAGAPPTAFMVQARTAGTQHWESLPMSGYSVDNLAPQIPEGFAGHYEGGAATLSWDPNPEVDLAAYRLYRGTTSSFEPGPASLVAVVEETAYVDAASAPYYYKLTAVDVHGNESPAATLLPNHTTDVPGPGGTVVELTLSHPRPNPTGVETTLRYVLPRDGFARLALYDAAGRTVRRLADGRLPAGEHIARWDLRDASGRAVAPGVYFARLETDGRALTRAVSVTR